MPSSRFDGRWSVPILVAVVIASDIGARYFDRFRSPCARHDTLGALSRIVIDRKAGSGLTLAAVRGRGRTGDRFACSATFDFVRSGAQAKVPLSDVGYTVTAPVDESPGVVDIPDDAWRRITAPP